MASWDEAIYSSVAQEMVQTGDWLRLRFGGGWWFDKPPLAIWATALFYKLLGVSEFSSRLFSALCGAGTVLAVYALGKKIWDSWAGFCGALMLVSAGFFITTARFATLDSPLVLFLTLAFLFFWMGRGKAAWFWASGAAFGLALMTKGFAAVLYPLVLVPYALWAGEGRLLLKKEFLGGLILAAAIAIPWHVYQIVEFPDAFWRDVVVRHLFSRTSHAIEGHSGGWYFYFRVLLNKFRPAIFLGVAAIPWFFWQAFRANDKNFRFITSWALAGFILITAIRTKLNWYAYPILPPLSLAVGYALSRLARPRLFAVVVLAATAAICSHGFRSKRFFQDYSAPVKAMAAAVKREVPAGTAVYLIRYHEDPAVTFYWQRPVAHLDDPQAIAEAVARGPFWALVRAEDYEGWRETFDRLNVRVKRKLEGFYWVGTPSVV